MMEKLAHVCSTVAAPCWNMGNTVRTYSNLGGTRDLCHVSVEGSLPADIVVLGTVHSSLIPF
jgi:hypothetical protein